VLMEVLLLLMMMLLLGLLGRVVMM
jgi:hypothetical protein